MMKASVKEEKAILSRDITKDNLVYGNDYYTLTVTAITTDKGKELKLFEDTMSDKNITAGQNFHELKRTIIYDKTRSNSK